MFLLSFIFRLRSFTRHIKDPLEKLVKHGDVERIGNELTVFDADDNARPFEQVQVMRYTGLADAKMVCNLPGREVTLAQELDNGPARGVVQRFEQVVQFIYLDKYLNI